METAEKDAIMSAKKRAHKEKIAKLNEERNALIKDRNERCARLNESYEPRLHGLFNALKEEKIRYSAEMKALNEVYYPKAEHTPQQVSLRYWHKMPRAIGHLIEEMNTKPPVDIEGVLTVCETSENGDIKLTIEIPIKQA